MTLVDFKFYEPQRAIDIILNYNHPEVYFLYNSKVREPYMIGGSLLISPSLGELEMEVDVRAIMAEGYDLGLYTRETGKLEIITI